MSQNPSPVNHDAAYAASSPSSPQHLPNDLPQDVGAVGAEEVEQSPDRLVAEQQPPLDVSDSEEVADPDDDSDDDEYIYVDLKEIRECVECPICLGIIKNTRVITECLHRFCKDCIEKAIRIGRNECPICCTHCPSRRSLKEDPRYDTLISGFFPDIDKFEEEEMPFLDEERIRNEQRLLKLLDGNQRGALLDERIRRQQQKHMSNVKPVTPETTSEAEARRLLENSD